MTREFGSVEELMEWAKSGLCWGDLGGKIVVDVGSVIAVVVE